MELFLKYQDIILLLLKLIVGGGLITGIIYAFKIHNKNIAESTKQRLEGEIIKANLAALKTTAEEIQAYREMPVVDRNEQFRNRFVRR